jgi:arylsulfatase A-like enzyme
VKLTRPIVIDTGRRKQALIGRDGLKIIRNLNEKTVELYDLRADPKELVNLVDDQPALAAERLGLLAAFFEAHELRRPGYVVPSRD